jgi:hypothetical protein
MSRYLDLIGDALTVEGVAKSASCKNWIGAGSRGVQATG